MPETYGLENHVREFDERGNVRTVTIHDWSRVERTLYVEIGLANYSYVVDHTAQDVLPLGGVVVMDMSRQGKLVVPIGEFKPEVQKDILGQVIKDSGFVGLVSLGKAITDLTTRIEEAAK